jgi:hypothetical protein
LEEQERQKWIRRIGKLDASLSVIAALIEIGLFLSYLKNVMTVETAAFIGIIVVLAFVGQEAFRKGRALKIQEAQQLLCKNFPAIDAYLKAMRSVPKEFRTDEQTLYTEAMFMYDVDRADAIYTKRVKGKNDSDRDLGRMLHIVCGETSIENGRVQPRAYRDLSENGSEKLEPAVIWSASNVKVISVDLNPAVRPRSGEVDVTFFAKWPGAFVSMYGYVFVSLLHFVKGLEKLVVSFKSTEKVTQCSVWTYDVKKGELKELEKLRNPKRQDNKYSINWQRPQPDINKIYILRYHRHISRDQTRNHSASLTSSTYVPVPMKTAHA